MTKQKNHGWSRGYGKGRVSRCACFTKCFITESNSQVGFMLMALGAVDGGCA